MHEKLEKKIPKRNSCPHATFSLPKIEERINNGHKNRGEADKII